ncbi:MAG: class II SORL domain-containing protein [Candidatus Asgardarchaeum sp.]
MAEKCVEPIVVLSKKAELTEYGKMHKPIIKIPDKVKSCEPFEVKIKVGEIPHPNTFEHYIVWIDLILDDHFLSRVMFVPIIMEPEVTLKIRVGKNAKLKVIARCNIHGQWEMEKEIRVE